MRTTDRAASRPSRVLAKTVVRRCTQEAGWARVSMLALSALTTPGCDAGKPIYKEAAALEAQGKLSEAAQKFDSVCQRAPKSAVCPSSKEQATRVRIKLAEEMIGTGRYVEARDLLNGLVSASDSASSGRAKELLAGTELVQGLLWLAASEEKDTAKAAVVMQTISQTPTAAAAKAKAWLESHQAAVLLAAARSLCSAPTKAGCAKACQEVGEKYPDAPESKEAQVLVLSGKWFDNAGGSRASFEMASAGQPVKFKWDGREASGAFELVRSQGSKLVIKLPVQQRGEGQGESCMFMLLSVAADRNCDKIKPAGERYDGAGYGECCTYRSYAPGKIEVQEFVAEPMDDGTIRLSRAGESRKVVLRASNVENSTQKGP